MRKLRGSGGGAKGPSGRRVRKIAPADDSEDDGGAKKGSGKKGGKY
jgi:hypothetical protein